MKSYELGIPGEISKWHGDPLTSAWLFLFKDVGEYELIIFAFKGSILKSSNPFPGTGEAHCIKEGSVVCKFLP